MIGIGENDLYGGVSKQKSDQNGADASQKLKLLKRRVRDGEFGRFFSPVEGGQTGEMAERNHEKGDGNAEDGGGVLVQHNLQTRVHLRTAHFTGGGGNGINTNRERLSYEFHDKNQSFLLNLVKKCTKSFNSFFKNGINRKL